MKHRVVYLALCLAMVLCLLTGAAQADGLTTDNLQIMLTADQESYDAGEQIKLILTVRNTGDTGLQLSSTSGPVPENIVPAAQQDAEACLLPANEIHTREFLFSVKASAASLPRTGDGSQPMLWLALLAASAIGVCFLSRKMRRRLLVLVLCVSLLGSLCPAGLTLARADEEALEMTFDDYDPETETVLPAAETDEADPFMELCRILTATNPVVSPSVAFHRADETLEVGETVLVDGRSVTLTVSLSVSEAVQGKEPSSDTSIFRNSKITDMMNKSLMETFVKGTDGTQIVYWESHTGASTVLPSSGGSYPNSADYLYCLSGGAGVNSMTLFFDGNCQTEAYWDAVIVYDGYGRYKGTFTGAALKNKVLTVSGPGVYIRLVSDVSNGAYGFGLTRVIPNRTPSVTSCSLNTSGKPVIKWNRLYGYTGYVVERAAVSSSGSVGAYQSLSNVAVSSSNASTFSYTDNTAVSGTAYAYRIRQRFVYGTAKLTSPPSSGVSVFTLAPTSITSATAQMNGTTPQVALRWNAVSRANKYLIYRSTELNGPYTQIAATTATSYVTNLPAKQYYYFRIRPCTTAFGREYAGPLCTARKAGFAPAAAQTLTAPTNLRVGTTAKGTINVGWNKVTGATGYEIYYSQYGTGTFTRYTATTLTGLTLTQIPVAITKPVIRVRAYRTSGGSTTYGPYSSTVTGDPVTVRALHIVEENYVNNVAQTRENCYNLDVPRLKQIFTTASPYGRDVALTYSYKDQSKSQLISRIGTMAGLADSNDITIFSIGTHGASGVTTGAYAGELILSDGNWLTFGELATELKKIPGRVVILVQSCGSGSSIQSDSADVDLSASLIKAIAAVDEEITLLEVQPDSEGIVAADTGELRVSNKFYVITASRGGESSWRNSVSGSYLFNWMQAGLWAADANGDRTVTLAEMEVYLQRRGNETLFQNTYKQIPQAYPSGSSFPMFVE